MNYNPDEIPHSKTSSKVDCKTCHDDLKGLEKSVHNQVNCYDCHSKHDVKPVKEIDQTKNCLSCHKSKNIQQFSSSIHAKKNIGCDDCHNGGHNSVKISKSEVTKVCGTCHSASIVVTASFDEVHFIYPIKHGQVVILKSKVSAVFNTSMEVETIVIAENILTQERTLAAKALCTFVALDEHSKPKKCPKLIDLTLEQQQIQEDAKKRRALRLTHR